MSIERDFTGTWSLAKIVSAVKNNLEAGLKTTGNYNFSLEQLEHLVIAVKNFLYRQAELQGTLDKSSMYQEINCIKLDCENLELCCKVDTKNPVLHFVLPQYLDIDIISSVDRQHQFNVYKDTMWNYNHHRHPSLIKRPYVWLRQYRGEVHGFLFNPPSDNLEYISATLILENPLEINKYNCCELNPEYDRFPIPQEFVNQIINEITNNWASWYYRFNSTNKPNNQTSLA